MADQEVYSGKCPGPEGSQVRSSTRFEGLSTLGSVLVAFLQGQVQGGLSGGVEDVVFLFFFWVTEWKR